MNLFRRTTPSTTVINNTQQKNPVEVLEDRAGSASALAAYAQRQIDTATIDLTNAAEELDAVGSEAIALGDRIFYLAYAVRDNAAQHRQQASVVREAVGA